MTCRSRKLLVNFWMMAAFGFAAALALPQARAEVIGTETAHAQDERARMRALMERPEVSKGLERLGLNPAEAAARVDAMSDAEVLQLAGRLDAAIAGGQLTNEQLLLIVIIVLLIVIII
jgi:hypothetical protein